MTDIAPPRRSPAGQESPPQEARAGEEPAARDACGSCGGRATGVLAHVALCCGLPVALVVLIGLVAAAVSAGSVGTVVLAAVAVVGAGVLLAARRRRTQA